MPEKKTLARVRKDRRAGKAKSTQAGEFIREEIDHIREGKHGARSTRQAVAIGLSKARRAGVALPPPKKGSTSAATRERATRDLASAKRKRAPSAKRSRASLKALERAGQGAAAAKALSLQATRAAKKRTPAERSGAARKAARTRKHRAG